MTSPGMEEKTPDSTSGTDGAVKESGDEQPPTGPGETYLTGARLFLVMTGVTLVMFLAMLDIAIITTVRRHVLPARLCLTI